MIRPNFSLKYLLLIASIFTIHSTTFCQKPLGKKLAEKTLELQGYKLQIGDTLELGKGSYYTGDFLYIFAKLGNKPSPLGASIVNEKVVIDHFRQVKNKYGAEQIIIFKYGSIHYHITPLNKAIAEGELKPPKPKKD